MEPMTDNDVIVVLEERPDMLYLNVNTGCA